MGLMNKNVRSTRLLASSVILAAAAIFPLYAKAETATPVTKTCVDGHQTSDPSSPPCQPYFGGDNGGATGTGVTGDEVTALIYMDSAISLNGSDVGRTPPAGTYCDLDLLDCDGDGARDADSHTFLRVNEALSRYFNNRFQTYNRHVHLWVYFGRATDGEAAQRATAADNFLRLHPFAVVDQGAFSGFKPAYYHALSSRGVMVFSAADALAQPHAFFAGHAPYVWDFWPDAETRAYRFVRYVCDKVAPTAVTEGPFKGEARTYALYTSGDPASPVEQFIGDLVKQGVQSCGISIGSDATFTFDHSGYVIDATGRAQATALRNALKMRRGDFNTVLYAGGSESEISRAAQSIGYLPQWIALGDGTLDGAVSGHVQGQVAWSHAWVVSDQSLVGSVQDQPGYRAYREAEPEGTDAAWAPDFYRGFMMLFDAIQLAGPQLTPQNVDTGLHSIQPYLSYDPYSPALFFESGDYSFSKDALETWWDPTARDENGNIAGCYRAITPRRNTASSWSSSTASGLGSDGSEKNGSDPCSNYSGKSDIRTPLG